MSDKLLMDLLYGEPRRERRNPLLDLLIADNPNHLEAMVNRNPYAPDPVKGQETQQLKDSALMGLLSLPVAGDVLGLGMDAHMYATEPESRNWLNYTLSAVGALPFVPAAAQAAKKITAYHGSPHDFDQFSTDKIGTGEGAQAYGHGLYFAENEKTAKAYRDKLAGDRAVDADGNIVTSRDMAESYGNTDKLTQAFVELRSAGWDAGEARRAAPALGDAIDEVAANLRQASKGHMYQVEIDASPDELLDWDRPLSEQPEKVRNALNSLPDPKLRERISGKTNVGTELSGSNIYDEVQRYFSPRRSNILDGGHASEGMSDASGELRDLGIKGIKYLDGFSRAAGEGSRNYVIFDDRLITIAKKYGVAIPVAAAMLAKATGEDTNGMYQEG